MKTTTMAFAKRKAFYQFIPGGAAVIGTPRDSIYLTITGPEDVFSPSERMTTEEMVQWLQELRGRGFSIQAVER